MVATHHSWSAVYDTDMTCPLDWGIFDYLVYLGLHTYVHIADMNAQP